jgi:AmmeMemoRadiSam system protein B
MDFSKSRDPAVAGMFYPSDPDTLRQQVQGFIDQARPSGQASPPTAIIAPHAGYIYSGPIAGSAYQRVQHAGQFTQRVLLLGPSHYVAFTGLALSHHAVFHTPLGDVPVDANAIQHIQALPQVQFIEAAHEREHCLEVHLPFLQVALDQFSIIPLVVGSATPEEVAEVLDLLWDEHTLVVVSSDLSHYLDYTTACTVDARTCDKIEQLDYSHLKPEEACGAHAVAGLLKAAMRRHLTATTLDLRNSGDTEGDKDRVVGYGAWSFN